MTGNVSGHGAQERARAGQRNLRTITGPELARAPRRAPRHAFDTLSAPFLYRKRVAAAEPCEMHDWYHYR